jgi:hypothetical protein
MVSRRLGPLVPSSSRRDERFTVLNHAGDRKILIFIFKNGIGNRTVFVAELSELHQIQILEVFGLSTLFDERA